MAEKKGTDKVQGGSGKPKSDNRGLRPSSAPSKPAKPPEAPSGVSSPDSGQK